MKTQYELYGLPSDQQAQYNAALADVRKEITALVRRGRKNQPLSVYDEAWNAALVNLLQAIRIEPGCPGRNHAHAR